MLFFKVQTLHNINKYSENLQSLHIGNSVQVLPNYLQPEVRKEITHFLPLNIFSTREHSRILTPTWVWMATSTRSRDT